MRVSQASAIRNVAGGRGLVSLLPLRLHGSGPRASRLGTLPLWARPAHPVLSCPGRPLSTLMPVTAATGGTWAIPAARMRGEQADGRAGPLSGSCPLQLPPPSSLSLRARPRGYVSMATQTPPPSGTCARIKQGAQTRCLLPLQGMCPTPGPSPRPSDPRGAHFPPACPSA